MAFPGACPSKRVRVWLLAFVWPMAAFRDFDVDLGGEVSAVLAPMEASHQKNTTGSASVGSNAGREATADSSASAAGAVPPGGDQPGFFNSKVRVVTIQPGASGIALEGGTYIQSVALGSKGEHAGLEAGERIVLASGRAFKPGHLARLESGTEPYTLTIASPSPMMIILQEAAFYLKVPAVLMGGCLILGMIP